MKKLICALTLSGLTLHGAFAADNPPTDNESADETTTTEAAAPIEVKHKSSFSMDESSRNPFWPVGWRPATKLATGSGAEHATQDIPTSAFLVSSITVDSAGRFAIVNGKVMNEGQVFGLQMGNQTYQLTVKAIQDGQIILQRRDQEIVVPLHRR